MTGGSKGIGRGVALQLGKAGATVYVTGRSEADLKSCCSAIDGAGGKGIPLRVDHSNVREYTVETVFKFREDKKLFVQDEEVEKLFETIKKEQQGKLDLLVNNAYAGVNTILKQSGTPFWENDAVGTWDIINNVGLRNHYLCTVYASRYFAQWTSFLCIFLTIFPLSCKDDGAEKVRPDHQHLLRRRDDVPL